MIFFLQRNAAQNKLPQSRRKTCKLDQSNLHVLLFYGVKVSGFIINQSQAVQIFAQAFMV